MSAVLRQAFRRDIAAMHAVRLSVHENVLASPEVTEASYIPAIETTGRGWVMVEGGEVIVGFAIANSVTGNIWALFVRPEYEGRGYGRALQSAMLSWLFAQGVARAWLSTQPNTRAQRFYERSGWSSAGALASGELAFDMRAPGAA